MTSETLMRTLYWRTFFLLAWAALTVLVSARAAYAVAIDAARAAGLPDAGVFARARER